MNSINATSAAAPSLLSGVGANQAMGKDDFLRLLITQLQNQDPLNPSDPTEFTAQLAQFSSLEQFFEMNANLGRMAAANADMERLSALNLIGRDVISEGGNFRLSTEEISLGYRLNGAAQKVNLHVLDAAGRTVASIPANEMTQGEHFLSWDGRDQNGDKVAPGEYFLVVTALAGKDEAVPVSPLVQGKVTGVDLAGNGSVLVSTAGDFQLKDVVRVNGG